MPSFWRFRIQSTRTSRILWKKRAHTWCTLLHVACASPPDTIFFHCTLRKRFPPLQLAPLRSLLPALARAHLCAQPCARAASHAHPCTLAFSLPLLIFVTQSFPAALASASVQLCGRAHLSPLSLASTPHDLVPFYRAGFAAPLSYRFSPAGSPLGFERYECARASTRWIHVFRVVSCYFFTCSTRTTLAASFSYGSARLALRWASSVLITIARCTALCPNCFCVFYPASAPSHTSQH